ncbi:hypothetical protein RHGRI_037012 [Rhododendron griersonianum]|uniref:DNA helicase Pif1-like 2B domain-containing protein n=1 Tax=Rhododendron griersonianum TaxID=479676 RepID=A0AAV6HQN3_9ERIC|nr:hypothetical protein RHGRI_037012 [Rhododendron griersonianum]
MEMALGNFLPDLFACPSSTSFSFEGDQQFLDGLTDERKERSGKIYLENSCVEHKFKIFDDICVLTLNLNMRLNTINPGNAAFANFLMEVGTNPQEVVHLPLTIGNRYTYLAANKMSEDDGMDRSITNRYPNEYLNSLDPIGLPPFKLELKVGSPIILLRNIAPKDGLCNGTRMMVVRCSSRIIEVKILTGEQFGKLAFIPRISLSPSSSEQDCDREASKLKRINMLEDF